MYPFINVFGISIPVYGICMATAFVLAIVISFIRTKKAGLNQDKFLNLAIIALLAGIVGAYLLFIFITYPISEIINSIVDGSFTVFKAGGLVFYGGLIFGALGAIIYCRIAKLKVSEYAAVIVPSLPLAHAVGRLGCFFAGCCYGKTMESPFSVHYSHPAGGAPVGVAVFPIQLLESLINLIIFAVLMIFTRKRKKDINVLFLYLSLYAVARFVLEYYRADELRGIFFGISTSQWISIGLLIFSVTMFLIIFFRQKRNIAIIETDAVELSANDDESTDGDEATQLGCTTCDECADESCAYAKSASEQQETHEDKANAGEEHMSEEDLPNEE